MLNAERTTWCTKERYVEICDLVAHAPERLTDDDLAELLHPDPANERKARAARERAREKARAAAANPPAPVTTPAPAATTTEAQRSAALVAARDYLEATERREAVFERFVSGVELADEEYELIAQPVPAYALLALDKFVTDINENNKMRNARIEALEQKHADLEARAGDGARGTPPVQTTAIAAAPHTAPFGSTGDTGLDTRSLPEAAASRLDALEQRMRDFEARALAPEYCGTFKPGETYRRGGLVTKAGGLWLCLTDTALIPGSNPTAWKLIVKSGDAR